MPSDKPRLVGTGTGKYAAKPHIPEKPKPVNHILQAFEAAKMLPQEKEMESLVSVDLGDIELRVIAQEVERRTDVDKEDVAKVIKALQGLQFGRYY